MNKYSTPSWVFDMFKHTYLCVIFCLFSCNSLAENVNAAPIEIRLPKISDNDVRYHYPSDLLKFLLDKTGKDYRLTTTESFYSQARAVESLKANRIQIYWMGTSAKAEKELRAVRYPIYRGLMGFRVFIINKEHQARFRTIFNLSDLQRLTGVQGIGWSDVAILEASKLHQQEHHYETAFQLIQAKRVDYFSRSIHEAFLEVDSRIDKYPDISVDDQLLLTYPFAMFFFTGKDNSGLADLLQEGFEISYQDGSFVEFFYTHPVIKGVIEKSNLQSRVRIDIPNHTLSKESKSIPQRFWHTIERLK